MCNVALDFELRLLDNEKFLVILLILLLLHVIDLILIVREN